MRCPAIRADGHVCLREEGHSDAFFPPDGHNWQPPMGQPVPDSVACDTSETLYQQALLQIGLLHMEVKKQQERIEFLTREVQKGGVIALELMKARAEISKRDLKPAKEAK